MTGTERIKALLNGTTADRTPISGWLHMPTVDRYIDRFVAEEIAFTDQNDWDFIKVMPNGHHLAEAYGAKIHFLEDPKRWSADILEYPIRTVEDFVNLPVLDPKENPVLKREVEVVRRLAEHYKGTKPILPTLFNPITWVQEMNQSTVPGPTLDFLRNHKKELHAVLETILQTNLRLADAYIEAGADGFVYKDISTTDLLTIIRSTMAGYSTFPSERTGDLSDSGLTQEEVRIVRLFCEAKSRREIAQELCLSEGTVKRRISEILAKTGYDSILHLAVDAISKGYIVPRLEE